jgi:hypothetical protein
MTVEQAEIRVIRGRPTDDEVAALVAVVLSLAEAQTAARARDAAGRDDRPRPNWTERPAYRPPGAWTTVQIAQPVIRRGEG